MPVYQVKLECLRACGAVCQVEAAPIDRIPETFDTTAVDLRAGAASGATIALALSWYFSVCRAAPCA